MRKALIIILTLIVILGTGWYFYAKSHQTSPGVPSITDFSAFFPIGEENNPNIGDNLLTDPTNPGSEGINSPFKRLSASPIAGFSFFDHSYNITIPADVLVPKSKPTVKKVNEKLIRYVSRTNGYVYEIKEGELPLQITNIYIPNIYEAIFADNSKTAILRFLRDDEKTIATYSIPVPDPNPDNTRTQNKGVYFPNDISAITTSPDSSKIARIVSDTKGGLLRLTNSTNSKTIDLLQTYFKEWIISWPVNKNIYLQTKASAKVAGYLYKVDTTERKLRRVLGGIDGLTALVSPTGNYIIYSQSTSEGFITRLFNTKDNSTKTLNLTLLPEKCTWLADDDLICAGNSSVQSGQYPDDWYKGLISFSDNLYLIYTASAVYDTLYDNNSRSFDMINLEVDEDNRRIFFIDKKTGYLWQMKY